MQFGGEAMSVMTTQYTTENILNALGYADPLDAARQQARMILLGRQARYEALVHQLEHKWGRTLIEMRAQYSVAGAEDAASDDDYLDWQWYTDAIAAIRSQLDALAKG
jgi:hypothetical protein